MASLIADCIFLMKIKKLWLHSMDLAFLALTLEVQRGKVHANFRSEISFHFLSIADASPLFEW